MKLLHMTGALVGLSLFASAWSGLKDAPCVWLANDLIGMKVISQDGENLGKIEDVVVHSNGRDSYAVLSFGGWLGMGDKLFAMPWSVLHNVEPDSAKKDTSHSLVLPLAKERFKTAPGFDKKNWPNMANADWTKDIDTFYVGDVNPNTKRPVDASAPKTSVTTWRVTELKGTNIKTPGGDKLGDLKEVAVDPNGRACYVSVSVGGFLGIGDRIVAVPWDSLKFSLVGDKLDKKQISLASTKEQLEKAPQFKEAKEGSAEMCDPKWVTRVYEYYSCPMYWTLADNVGVKGSK